MCRADRPIPESLKRKISLMCDVDNEAVVAAADAPSIYDIPKVLHAEGLDAYVVRRLGLPFRDVDWTEWDDLLRRVHHPTEEVTVAPGRQVRRPARRLPVGHRGAAGRRVRPRGEDEPGWVPSDECQTREGAARHLGDVDAVCVPGGFGIRGIEGKVGALELRPHPRHPDPGPVPGPAVHGDRVRPATRPGIAEGRLHRVRPRVPAEPVIATMAEQQHFVEGPGDLGGTMRLGLYPAELQEGSVVRETYREAKVEERHRHRYEVNNAYREQLEEAGLVFSGTSPDGSLVEFVELPREVHPYYVSTQAHPELRSRPTRPHPLFAGLVGAVARAEGAAVPPIESRPAAPCRRAAEPTWSSDPMNPRRGARAGRAL